MAGDQLTVLNALDVAKTQLYHFTAIVIAGMGFFTDAYDLFCISLVTKLLGRIYYHVDGAKKPGTLPPNVSAAVNGVALCGTLAGQLFFGWLGDKLGRKKVYGITLILMVIGSISSGLSFGKSAKGVISTLCFFRFWLGFGIGGDYPLSATIMSEYANKKTRGAFIAAVFAMQGFGILAGGIVALIVSSAFDHQFKAPPYSVDPVGSTAPEADYVWRIVLMVGALPAALTYYWRMRMPETARYTALIAKNAKQAAADMSKVLQVELEAEEDKLEKLSHRDSNSFGLFSREFLKRHGLHLFGTTSTWFLLDIAFYSQNLFQKDIFSAIGWIPPAATMNAIHEVYKIARAQTLIALCSTVPGYWFTVAFIDYMGRFAIQMMGFFFMTVFMFALAIPYHHWTLKPNRIGFVIMYSLTFFFANFGPNATTFVVPAEIFPARLRSTCHGISAAAGKAGAIVGAFGFLYAAQSKDPKKRDAGYPAGIGVKNSLIMLGVVNFLGMICTLCVPESKPGRHVGSAATHVFHISPRVFPGSMSVWPARVSLAPHTLRFRVSAAGGVGHLLHDAGATAAVLVGAYGLVLSFDNLSQRKLIQQSLSRKLVHILSGLLFMVSWPIFSTSTEARYFAALVPLVNCLRLVINGLSLVKDDGLIKSVTREGNPKELLRGPLYYVLMLILSALVFWRDSPVGVISLSMMCGGDGVADVIGRRFGSMKIFYNEKKSWAGSISMFVFGFLVSIGMLYFYSILGYYQLDLIETLQRVALVSLVATVVESLPITEVVDDNISVPLASMVAAYLSFGY